MSNAKHAPKPPGIHARLLSKLFRVVRVESSAEDIERRRYERPRKPWSMADTADKDAIIGLLQVGVSDNARRRDEINGKMRTILQLVTVQLGATITIGQKVAPTWLAVVPLVCGCLTVWALVVYLGVNYTSGIVLDRNYTEAEGKEQISLAMINDLQTSLAINEGVCDFLLDAYRAARRLFVVSFLTLVAVASYWMFQPSHQSNESKPTCSCSCAP